MELVGDTFDKTLLDLTRVDLATLSDGEVHRGLFELLEARSTLDALIAKTAQQWTERGVWAQDGSRAAGARLARDANMRKAAAYNLVHRADVLVGMPLAYTALEAGRITVDHVDLLAHANTSRRRQQFERDEHMLVDYCTELAFWAAAKAIKQWMVVIDAELGDDGPEPTWVNRRASSRRGVGDEVIVEAIFDAVGGGQFIEAWDRIDNEFRLADEAAIRAGDTSRLTRTAGQRRADALVEMAIRATANNNSKGSRPRPLITVVVGDDSFRKLCELSDGTVVAPGALVPYLADTDVETMIFDGPFHAIAGSYKRTFTGLVRRAVEVRDRHCQHPDSDGDPISRCDVDHIVPVVEGGITCQCNGQLMERGRNRDLNRRNLTAADITVWHDDPGEIALRNRIDDLVAKVEHPPNTS